MKKRVISGLLCLVVAISCVACNPGGEPRKEVITYDPMDNWVYPEVDPRGVSAGENTATGRTNPQIVETTYETEEVVVADIVPTEMGYPVDPTGKTDSTDGIQAALYDCFKAGGGTVYLPAGNYVVTGTIFVPSYVTLRGDYQDADEGTDYGTVISIWADSKDTTSEGTFAMSGCSGVVGVTVYYPLQTLYQVLPYPYAFYLAQGTDGRVVTLKDINIINAYRGIGTEFELNHECLMIENVKGTFLNTGFGLNNQSDVGHIADVTVSSKYWLEASKDYMNRPTEYGINTYMKENTTAFLITDLDWPTFHNIKIDGCAFGMTVKKGYRGYFVGEMIDVSITNCTSSVRIEATDERWGSIISRANLEGEIVNVSKGVLKLNDTTHKGELKEFVPGSVSFEDYDLSGYDIKFDATYKKPVSNLTVVKLKKTIEEDASAPIQKALDSMAKQGGGVVYIPGGNYRLDKPIDVPAGVELRGACSVPNREQNSYPAGTLFMCYYGDDASVDPEKDRALVTLNGDYAGISGIRFIYPENGVDDKDLKTTYVIRGKGKGVYAVNCFILAAGYGVDFRDCDEHYIEQIYSCCWFNTYRLGGKDGVIRDCVQNGNMVTRTNAEGLPEDWPEELEMKERVTTPILVKHTENVIVENAENQQIIGVFAYATKRTITNRNSKNTLCANVGSDWLEFGVFFTQDGGDMTVINSMQALGTSYDCIKGKLTMYNRITIDEPHERFEEVEK